MVNNATFVTSHLYKTSLPAMVLTKMRYSKLVISLRCQRWVMFAALKSCFGVAREIRLKDRKPEITSIKGKSVCESQEENLQNIKEEEALCFITPLWCRCHEMNNPLNFQSCKLKRKIDSKLSSICVFPACVHREASAWCSVCWRTKTNDPLSNEN